MNAQPPTGPSLSDDQPPFWLPMSVLQDDQPPFWLPMCVLQDSLGDLREENDNFCVDQPAPSYECFTA